MTTDLIIDAFAKLQDISFVKVWRSIRNGWYDQEIEFRKERAVALIDGQLVATGKKKYTGEDGRMSAASKKALMINDNPLPIELLAMANGNTAELRDVLPFSGYTGGFQKIEDEELHSSEKLDAILGEGNYTFMVTYGDYSGQKRLYIKIDIVNEYSTEEEITPAEEVITLEMTTVEIETPTDLIWLAIDKLEDDCIVQKRHGGKMYRKYDENIAVGFIEGNFINLHKLLSTAMQDLNHTPLDIELLEMADGNPEELKDLLAFSNYNKGFQLVADTEYYSSMTMDAILGEGTYSFIMMDDDLGDHALYIKIHLDRI